MCGIPDARRLLGASVHPVRGGGRRLESCLEWRHCQIKSVPRSRHLFWDQIPRLRTCPRLGNFIPLICQYGQLPSSHSLLARHLRYTYSLVRQRTQYVHKYNASLPPSLEMGHGVAIRFGHPHISSGCRGRPRNHNEIKFSARQSVDFGCRAQFLDTPRICMTPHAIKLLIF